METQRRQTMRKQGEFFQPQGKNFPQLSINQQRFTENRVFFQKIPIDLLNNDVDDDNENQAIIRNFNDCVFQIWPKLNFDAHKEYRKVQGRKEKLWKRKIKNEQNLEEQLVKKKEINTIALEDSYQEDNDKQLKVIEEQISLIQVAATEIANLLSQLEQDIMKLKDRVTTEKQQNLKMLSNMQGKPVAYGYEIQLMHYMSSGFLCGKIVVSEFDKSAYKFVLSNQFGYGMIFKIMPKFKLRQEGEKIQFKDQVLLKNIKLGCFVNFSTEQQIMQDQPLKKLESQEDAYHKIDFRGIDTRSVRYESHLSHIQDTTFQILLFSNDDKQYPRQEYLKGGDLIRLQHTELEGFLAADHAFVNPCSEVFVRIYTGDFPEENYSADTVWEIEMNKPSKRGNTCTLSQIDQDYNTHDQTFRLRHFRTGKLLSFMQSRKGTGPCIAILGNHIDEEENGETSENSLLTLNSTTISQKNQILNNECYMLSLQRKFIKVQDKIKYQGSNEEGTNRNMSSREENVSLAQQLKESFYTALKDEEYEVERKGCVLSKRYSEENAFFIRKVTNEEKIQMLNVQSGLPILIRMSQILKWKHKDELTAQFLKNVIRVLEELIFFILKIDSNKLQDAVSSDGIPQANVQRLFKDMKIIEILGDILYYTFQEGMFELNTINLHLNLQRILQLSYRLIKHSIREYRPNELYASQWIDLFMVHVMNTNLENELLSEPTLTELIDNNALILNNKIKKSAIHKFTSLLKDKHEKYVNILRALVNCDGEAVVSNQGEISKEKHGIITREHKSDLLFELKDRQDETQIDVYHNWISLRDFEDRSKEDDSGRYFKYFCAIINLCADLCLDRNFIAMEPLKKLYPYEVCYEIISNNEYSMKLRHSFTRLVTTLWIDEKFVKIQLPDRIRVWSKLDSNNSDSQFNDVSNFSELTSFIRAYIEEITDLKPINYQKAYDDVQNQFTQAVLHLASEMLLFGFYSDKKELIELLKVLLKLLNGTADIAIPEEAQYIDSFNKNKKQVERVNMEENQLHIPKHGLKYRLRSRYSDKKEENLILMETKKIICEILIVIYNMRTEGRINEFLKRFQNFEENPDDINVSMHSPTKPSGSHRTKYNQLVPMKNIEDLQNEKLKKLPLEWIDYQSYSHNYNFEDYCETDFVMILQDCLLYKHPELVELAFHLLNIHFSQKKLLVENLQDIQLIESEEMQNSFKDYKKLDQELQDLAESSENWYGFDESNAEAKKASDKYISYMKQFCAICTTTMLKPDDDVHVQSNIRSSHNTTKKSGSKSKEDPLSSDRNVLDNVYLYQPGQVPNTQYQTLFRNFNAYESAFEILKYDISTSNYTDYNNKPQTLKVLSEIYRFLAKLCHKQPKAQKIMMKHMDKFMYHLIDERDIPSYFLIQEVYRDNKEILMNPQKIMHLITDLVVKISKTPQNYIKSFLLESLKVFIYYKSRVIVSNQTFIIDQLSSKQHSNLLILLSNPDHKEKIIENMEDYHEQLEAYDQSFKDQHGVQRNLIVISPFLSYYSCQMFILACLTEDKNGATESKCQSYYSIDQITKLLQITEKQWDLRKNILLFYYHVYCDTEKEMTEEQQEDINKITEIALDDWRYICHYFLAEKQTVKSHRGIYRMREIKEDYLINGLCMVFDATLKGGMYNGQLRLNRVYEWLLDDIIEVQPYIEDPSSIKALQNIVALTINRPKVNPKYKQKLMKTFFPQKNQAKAKKKHLQRRMTMSVGVFNKRKSSSQSKATMFQEQLQNLITDDEFTQQCQNEFDQLISSITKIQENSEAQFGGFCTIYFEEIASAFITQIDQPLTRQNQSQFQMCLKVLRMIIERENKDEEIQTSHKPCYEWEPNEWSFYKDSVVKRQNLLCDLGIIQVLGNLISQENILNYRAIQNETVILCVALLLGGNKKAQNLFYEFFQKDSKNTFLLNLYSIISSLFSIISKNMKEKNEQIVDQMLEDSEEMGDNAPINMHAQKEQEEKDDTFEDALECMENLVLIFRLLQLYCEGHNQVLQDYLRKQVQNDIVHGKTQNFIRSTGQIFGSYIKFVNVYCVDLGDQIIEFLIESLQGPCQENQNELARNKIVDFVKDFIVVFPRQIDFKRRGFNTPDKQNSITSIMTKSTSLLISLLEGNENKEILNILCEGLDIKYLKQRLVYEYTQYIVQVLGKNINTKPFEIQEALKKQSQYEGNIEEAFNMYILLMTLADYNEKVKQILETNQIKPQGQKFNDGSLQLASEEDTMEFFKTNTKSIEILFRDNKLYKVYFPLEPVCMHLSKVSKTNLMLKVPRDSANEKILGLITDSEILFDEMRHMSYLSGLWFKFSAEKFNKLNQISTFLAILINIVILFTYVRDVEATQSVIIIQQIDILGVEINTEILLMLLGIIQLGTSSLMLCFWFVIQAPQILQGSWRELVEENRQKQRDQSRFGLSHEDQLGDSVDIETLTQEQTRNLLRLKGPYYKVFRQGNKKKNFGFFFTVVEYYWTSLKFLLAIFEFNYLLLYIGVSFMGLTLVKIAYSFHLFDLIVTNFPIHINSLLEPLGYTIECDTISHQKLDPTRPNIPSGLHRHLHMVGHRLLLH